jgi:hypothetical protein
MMNLKNGGNIEIHFRDFLYFKSGLSILSFNFIKVSDEFLNVYFKNYLKFLLSFMKIMILIDFFFFLNKNRFY